MNYLLIILMIFNIQIIGGNDESLINLNKKVYGILDSSLIDNDFNGVILIANSDSILFCYSDGYADFEHKVDVDENSKFNIASLTKQFTAAAILFLEETAQLSTTDTINKYFSEYKYSDQITIHQLLTHTSGIPSYNFFDDYDDFSKKNSSSEEIINWIEHHPLKFEPGTDFEYSNSGYYILSRIIERVSGKSYRDFLHDNIFSTAGMMNSDNYTSLEIIPNQAFRYQINENRLNKATWFDLSFKLGSSSIFSTSLDLFNWYRSLTSYDVISQKSVNKMFTDYFDGYGYGIGKGDSERKFFEHDGKIPGINAYSAFFLEPNYYLLVWSNTANKDFWKLRDELKNIVINL